MIGECPSNNPDCGPVNCNVVEDSTCPLVTTFLKYNDPKVRLFGDESSIGRSITVHNNFDDLGLTDAPTSKINGNSGPRVGCGTIIPVRDLCHLDPDYPNFKITDPFGKICPPVFTQ